MNRWFAFLIILFASCKEPQTPSTKTPHVETNMWEAPAANTVVASYSMRIPDVLNELYFSIEVIATNESAKGVYEVLVKYGHNEASTQITMPDAHTLIVPEVKRSTDMNAFVIGFRYGNDTTFREYYLVNASKEKTEMKYLKAYSFR